MEAELILGIYLTFFGGAMSALFWTRMNRLEERMDGIEARMATKEDLAALRDEMHGRLEEQRGEMGGGFAGLRAEMAIMRSDLTHVALAVGARPRASEG